MLATRARSILLAAALLAFTAAASYSYAMAGESSADETSRLQGTFLVYSSDGTNHITALIDPSAVEIGGKPFLSGKVSGRIGDIWAGNAFSGSKAFIAVESITVIQEVKLSERLVQPIGRLPNEAKAGDR